MNAANNNRLTTESYALEAAKCVAVLVWGLLFVGSGFWALLAPTWQDPTFSLYANWVELATAGATVLGVAMGWLRFPFGNSKQETVFAVILAVAMLIDAGWNLCGLSNLFH
jgi:hypothetical protein